MEIASENSCANAAIEDRSQLNLPISTGVNGIHQVMRCIQGGTAEVRDLLFNECDLVYECRVCRSLFRSLANFLYHKREFCRKHLCENMVLFTAEEAPQEVVIVQPESPKEIVVENGDIENEDDFCDEDVDMPVADSQGNIELPKLGICTSRIFQAVEKTDKCKHTEDVTETWHTKDCNAKSSSAVAFYTKCANSLKLRSSTAVKKSVVSLKPIDSNPNAMFQSLKNIPQTSDTGKNQEVEEEEEPMTIAEVRQKLEAAKTAVVHVDNVGFHPRQRQRYYSDSTKSVIARLKERADCNVNTLNCRICKTQYMSVKTLDFHMRTIHSDKRLYYPCPFCKTSFVQLWGVTRHMSSVHQKTKDQISKLREVVRKRAFRKNFAQGTIKGVKKTSPKASASSTKSDRAQNRKLVVAVHRRKDLQNIKPNSDVYVCTTCGRTFDRKSSQTNHEKFCTNEVEHKPDARRSSIKPGGGEPSNKLVQRTEFLKTTDGAGYSEDSSGRPKRNVKKREEQDFVDSSAIGYSRIAQKPDGPVRKPALEALEKKILGIISTRHLQCLKCNRRFSTFSNLRRHAAIHVGWNRFKCKYCEYQAYNRSDCRNHIQRIHLQGKSSPITIDKLVIDLPSQHVKVKRENVDVANAKKNDLALWITQPSMQPSLTIKLTKTPSNVSLPVTPSTGADQKSKLGSSPSTRLSSKQSKNNSSLLESASENPSSVVGSPSSFPYGVSTRHTVRYPVSHPQVASDDISTLVTRSGMYRKTYLINTHSPSKEEPSKNQDSNDTETDKEVVEKDDSNERASPDLLFSTPDSGTSEPDPVTPNQTPELQDVHNGPTEEVDVPIDYADHDSVLATAEGSEQNA